MFTAAPTMAPTAAPTAVPTASPTVTPLLDLVATIEADNEDVLGAYYGMFDTVIAALLASGLDTEFAEPNGPYTVTIFVVLVSSVEDVLLHVGMLTFGADKERSWCLRIRLGRAHASTLPFSSPKQPLDAHVSVPECVYLVQPRGDKGTSV